MSGWFKHDRDLFSRPWAKDPKTVSVYDYLHCIAYVNDGILHGQKIRRGSCPVTRAGIMEATGLSAQEVRTRLKKLLDAGEIIVKSTNFGTIVTICDYCLYDNTNGLFELNVTNEEQPQQPPHDLPQEPTLYIKEGRITEDSLRSHYVPSKTERERRDVVLEIKKLYNKTFDGVLRSWERLSAEMRIKVNTCIRRFGRQSVDMVFEQVLHEKFSLGENDTGFIADFAFIFKLSNYEAYLGRYELRRRKQQTKKPPEAQPEPKPTKGSWMDALEENENWRPETK